jgi:hypothetical protein
MKRKLFLLSLAFVLCFSVSGVQAAYIVDLNPSATTVGFGEIFTIDVVLSITGGDLDLTSAGLDFTYEPSLVSLTDFALGPNPPVDPGFSFLPTTTTPGQINGFGAATFSSFSDNTLLATMTFAADSTIGLADFGIIASNSSGGWFDTVPNPVDIADVTVNGTSVNAVPIPGAFLLLGSGLIGLVGLRKKLK